MMCTWLRSGVLEQHAHSEAGDEDHGVPGGPALFERSSGGLAEPDQTDRSRRRARAHRDADGTPDVLTMYGGDTTTAGTAGRQEFPVDAESRDLFVKEGLQASVANTWAMEIEPAIRFVYELARPGRIFRVEFDLKQPVTVPPAPWGSTDTP
jgi:hypothetical protein